jgi:dihydroxyacid dehydratase/phosphogluconate dehydratase
VRDCHVHGGLEVPAQAARLGSGRLSQDCARPGVEHSRPESLATGWLATVQEHDVWAKVAPHAVSRSGPHSLVP